MRRVWKILKAAFGADNKTEPDLPESGPGDEQAVAGIVELLEAGLTVEDIATLSVTPSSQSNATDGATRDNATLQFIAANVMNPNIDQHKATEMAANIAIGADRAKQLIIATDDPNVTAIASRQQLVEISEMLDCVDMPVAGSDNHAIHRATIASKWQGILGTVQTAPTPSILKAGQLILSHYLKHITMDATMPIDQKQAETKAVQADLQTIQKVAATMAKNAAENPVPVAGQPPQVDPATGQVIGEDPNARQSINPDDAKLKLEVHKLGQEDQRIALEKEAHQLEASKIAHAQKMEESKLVHQQQMDALKLQQGNMGMIQKTGQDVMAAQGDNADRELQAKIAQQQADAAALQAQMDQQSQAQSPAAE
jgi:hypothetical protein